MDKTDLQEKLEEEGWRLLTKLHESNIPFSYIDELSDYNYIEDLKNQGMEVRLEDAYDCNGNLIPNTRAIYVRAKKLK